VAIRTPSQIRSDQASLLASYRDSLRADSEASTERLDRVDAVSTLAKVSSVVTFDAVHGPHLVASVQEFTGTPPVVVAASKPNLRAYPTPNRTVGDYSSGEYVLLHTFRGALLALKIS
jgi:hypothetical protein